MTRLLGLVVLAVVVWMFLEAGWARLKRGASSLGQPPKTLVRCSGCGVYVPLSEVMAGPLCNRCRTSAP